MRCCKLLLLALLIGLLLFSSGCLKKKGADTTTGLNELLELCKELKDAGDKDKCLLDLAKVQGFPDACTEIASAESRDKCFLEMASKISKESFCGQIQGTEKKNECYKKIASSAENYELCLKIANAEEKAECISGVASKTQNIGLCSKIAFPKTRESCLSNLSSKATDESICDYFSAADEKDDCLWKVAKNTGSSKVCSAIGISDKRDKCYKDIADAEDSLDPCLKILDQSIAYNCIRAIDSSLLSAEVCKNFSEKAIDECYSIVAGANVDPKLCEKISEQDEKDNCFAGLAEYFLEQYDCWKVLPDASEEECYSNAATLCRKVLDESQKDSCILKTAKKSSNPEYCAEIVGSKSSSCYKDFAISTLNAGLCSFADEENDARDCYNFFAVAELDVGYCAKIPNQKYRGECYTDLAEKIGKEDFCLDITESESQAECYGQLAMVFADDSYCAKLKDFSGGAQKADSCYFDFAKEFSNQGICSKISSSDLKTSCLLAFAETGLVGPEQCEAKDSNEQKDSCYIALVKVTFDEGYCKNVSVDSAASCYTTAALAKSSTSPCDSIDKTRPKDECYSSVAESAKDASICPELVLREVERECIIRVAGATQDEALCEELQSFEHKGSGKYIDCISLVALEKTDQTICDNIREEINEATCYSIVATALKNPSICEELPLGPSYKNYRHEQIDHCYLKTAGGTNSKGLCDQIVSEGTQNNCLCLFGEGEECTGGLAGNLTVTVTGKGAALENIRGSLFREGKALEAVSITGESGKLYFYRIPPTNYSLIVSDPAGNYNSTQLDVTINEKSDSTKSVSLTSAVEGEE